MIKCIFGWSCSINGLESSHYCLFVFKLKPRCNIFFVSEVVLVSTDSTPRVGWLILNNEQLLNMLLCTVMTEKGKSRFSGIIPWDFHLSTSFWQNCSEMTNLHYSESNHLSIFSVFSTLNGKGLFIFFRSYDILAEMLRIETELFYV